MPSRFQLITKALHSCRFRFYLTLWAVLTVSAYQHGYQMFALNNCENVVTEWLNNHTNVTFPGKYTLYSTTVAIFPAGGVLGSLLTFSVTKFGSVKVIFASGVLSTVGFLLSGCCGFSNSIACLIVGRLLGGIGTGLADGAAVIFLTEISPTVIRGILLSAFEMTLLNGFLSSQIAGLSNSWPKMMLYGGVANIVPLVVIWFCPETPRHLLVRKKEENAAKTSLSLFRKEELVDREFEILKEEETLAEEDSLAKFTTWNVFIALVVVMSEQVCGFPMLLYYSTKFFDDMKLQSIKSQHCTLVIGVVVVLSSNLSLHIIECTGRRKLFLISSLISVSLNTSFIFLVCLPSNYFMTQNSLHIFKSRTFFAMILIFAFAHGFGLGPIRWTTIGESFACMTRPLATSVTLSVNFAFNFLICQTFLSIPDSKEEVFLIPSAIWMFASFWIIYLWGRDTMISKKNLDKLDIY